ncbi:MAG: ATP-binding protein [Cyclobacteriaceae bacterium]|nr:ATP-binding protein [Cyclobacteriaceae bacterium]
MKVFTIALERFVPPELVDNEEQKTKAYILLKFLFCCTLSSILFSGFYFYMGLQLSFYGTLLSTFAFGFCFALVRTQTDLQKILRIVILWCYALITLLVIDSGGGNSIIISIFLLIPVLGFLFDTKKYTQYYVILCIATIIMFYGYDLFGKGFTSNINQDFEIIFNMAFKFFIFIFILLLFNIYNQQMRKSYDNIIKLNNKLEVTNIKMKEMSEQAINFSTYLTEVEDELTKTLTKERESKKQLSEAQAKLVQSEKMASLGQLTAGIAHEINNPVNFIQTGIEGLKDNIDDLLKFNEIQQKCWQELIKSIENESIKDDEGIIKKILHGLNKTEQSIGVKEALSEINELTTSIQNGAHRTTEIVQGLKTFSRFDENSWKPMDIGRNIDSTLVLLKNKYKDKAEIIKNYGQIPEVESVPGKLNQVFMNLLTNAIQAIEGTGIVTISTQYFEEKDRVQIAFSDTGNGISKEVQNKIYDPFFTTKDVGEGTGLGLAITKGIIDEHNAFLFFETEPGKGTTFYIDIPVKQPLNHNII